MQATNPARRLPASDAVGGEKISADICVIGAGAGGIAAALQAAAFGRSVILIEKNKMGGSALNWGCVPSKALLAAARRAEAFRTAGQFGVKPVEPEVDLRAVAAHVRSVITAIQPSASVERMTALGIRVILSAARFLDKRTVLAGDYRITARRFIIATGSSAAIPPIPGLAESPYFTTDTIFDNDRRLDHLIVVGGGSYGIELADAYRCLGSRVTLLESGRILAQEDPEFAALMVGMLRSRGVDVRENAMVEGIDSALGGIRAAVRSERGREIIEASHVLIAAGRRPNVSDLNLDVAGIKYDQRGISVTQSLVTTNTRVYAIGDVSGGLPSTHTSAYHAEVVMRRILFRLPAKVDAFLSPRVTFTDPELAHVGLSEQDSIRRNIPIRALRWSFHENDRAQAERTTMGHIKVLIDRKGRVLGATIFGASAGEHIHIWSLAVKEGLNIGKIATTIAPYPTLSDASRRAAIAAYSSVPSAPRVRKLINFLAKFG